MDLILIHLPTNSVVPLQRICSKFRTYVGSQWDLRLSFLILEIETLKKDLHPSLNKKIPLLYEGGFFSGYFPMLESILLTTDGESGRNIFLS